MEETVLRDICLPEESVINFISPDKNVPKRKSSIFNRKSAFFGNNETMESREMDEKSGTEFNVETYVTCLKKEVSEWETMYKERKQARKLTKRQSRSKNVLAEDDVFPLFNEEDKKFVQSRPDYHRIGREAVIAMEKLTVSLQKTIDIEKSLQLSINCVNKTQNELRNKLVDLSGLE